MVNFVGRERELRDLSRLLERVKRGDRLDLGITVAMRGRRRIGKSALATEFIKRSGVPSVYFQAARYRSLSEDLATFAEAIAASDLPLAFLAAHQEPRSLSDAFRLLAHVLPDNQPSVVVLDELPWLLEGSPGGAGELQRAWDRELSAKPVLLLLLGSNFGMMEALQKYDQPLYGRATPMVLHELTPVDVQKVLRLDAMAAFDAYLMTGGQPVTVMSWAPGASPHKFLVQTLADPTSALVASGAQILDSEFPEQAAARKVLRAIGGRGERAWSRVRDAAGLTQTSLERSLEILTDARVIAADEPVSTRRAPKEKRWRIADPALRYWLAMVEPVLPDIYRRRPDIAFSWHEERYSAWRGRAIEPVVRDALMRILPSDEWPDARHVGGWWPRSNNPEIDLVGVDTVPGNRVGLVGTIKWRRRGPVTTSEVTVAGTSALAVPGVMPSTPLVAVCPAGAVADQRLTATWTADDLLEAWPQ